MIKRLVSLLLSSAILAGCATPVRNYSPQRSDISQPPVGTVNVAHVGDNLVRQGSYTEHDAVLVQEEVTVGILATYTITRGYFLKIGEDQKTAFFSIDNRFDEGGRLVPSALADPPKAIQAYKDEKKLCGVSMFNAAVCATNVKFRFTSKPLATSDSFQQTLIYSGKVGNRISIGYREFSANVARPAFSNDVAYDLSESTIIGYKGARLEIIEATNEYVKYRVLRNFNVAE